METFPGGGSDSDELEIEGVVFRRPPRVKLEEKEGEEGEEERSVLRLTEEEEEEEGEGSGYGTGYGTDTGGRGGVGTGSEEEWEGTRDVIQQHGEARLHISASVPLGLISSAERCEAPVHLKSMCDCLQLTCSDFRIMSLCLEKNSIHWSAAHHPPTHSLIHASPPQDTTTHPSPSIHPSITTIPHHHHHQPPPVSPRRCLLRYALYKMLRHTVRAGSLSLCHLFAQMQPAAVAGPAAEFRVYNVDE